LYHLRFVVFSEISSEWLFSFNVESWSIIILSGFCIYILDYWARCETDGLWLKRIVLPHSSWWRLSGNRLTFTGLFWESWYLSLFENTHCHSFFSGLGGHKCLDCSRIVVSGIQKSSIGRFPPEIRNTLRIAVVIALQTGLWQARCSRRMFYKAVLSFVAQSKRSQWFQELDGLSMDPSNYQHWFMSPRAGQFDIEISLAMTKSKSRSILLLKITLTLKRPRMLNNRYQFWRLRYSETDSRLSEADAYGHFPVFMGWDSAF